MSWIRCLCVVLLSASFNIASFAQELNPALNEQVITITKKGRFFSFDLETTLYKPDGEGPFPIVVINHGKATGDTHLQSRYRPGHAARYFLQRGYAVVVPMRQGFSKSTGNYISGGCNVESNGKQQAEDVKAALDYVTALAWADKTRILVVGQSHGGWTTLAFGTIDYPGVKGLINFAGGLRISECPGWESTLARAAGSYGKQTKLPSLWFYGDNDSYFSPSTFKPMHEQYVAAGAKAKLVEFGKFESDAHNMFSSYSGEKIWEPAIEHFMHAVGLPNVIKFPRIGINTTIYLPPRTDYSTLQDVSKIPHINEEGRKGYKEFLDNVLPRAFAISQNGAWGWASTGDDPYKRALDSCKRHGPTLCKLYAVDNEIVWQP
jgi:dienelactone hydrolase